MIHQPQSAILWMGKAMETPVVRDHQIVIRWIMYLCLSYDHRIIMGAQAVRFLQTVKNTLENPTPLLLGSAGGEIPYLGSNSEMRRAKPHLVTSYGFVGQA
jgi:hypothetical protein